MSQLPTPWDLVAEDATACGHPPSIIADMIRAARRRLAEPEDDGADQHQRCLIRAYQHALDVVVYFRQELHDRHVDVGAMFRLGPDGYSGPTPGEDTVNLIELYSRSLNTLFMIRLHLDPTTSAEN